MKKVSIFLAVVTLVFFAVNAIAGVPQMINYQGQLTDPEGNSVEDGPYLIKFKIYGSAAGDDSLWSSGFQTVQVTNGLLGYHLGSGNPLPNDIFASDTSRWLGITVGTDDEIIPRSQLISAAYTYQALRADTASMAASLSANSVSSVNIVDGSIQFTDVGQNDAASGQVMKWNGSAWEAGIDIVGETNGWIDDGTVVRLETENDSIGIGIAAPEAKLDVRDNINEFAELISIQNTNTGVSSASVFRIRNDLNIATVFGRLGASCTNYPGYGNAGESFIYSGANGGKAFNFVVPDNIDGRLNFFVGTTASETPRMVIENNGNVGIGTATPTYKLRVNGSFSSNTVNTGQGDYELYGMNQNVKTTDNPTFNQVHITDYGIALDGFHVGGTDNPGTDNLVVDGKITIGSPGSYYKLQVNSNTNSDVGLSLQYYTGENNSPSPFLMLSAGVYRGGGYPGAALRAVNDIDATWGKKALAFYTRDNNSEDFGIDQYHERMRIGSNGRVGIGTINPAQELHVQGDICYTGSCSSCSDVRYKNEIKSIANPLSKVQRLSGINFRWRINDYPERNFEEGVQIGFIAQEVQDIIPEIVYHDMEGYLSVDYSRLTPVLVEAIKELKTQNDMLLERIKKLEKLLYKSR